MLRSARAALIVAIAATSASEVIFSYTAFGDSESAPRSVPDCRGKANGVYLSGSQSPLILDEGQSFVVALIVCEVTEGNTVRIQVSGAAVDDNLLEEPFNVVAQKAVGAHSGLSFSTISSRNSEFRLTAGSYQIEFVFKLARGRPFTGADAAPWASGKQEQVDFIITPGNAGSADVQKTSLFKLVTQAAAASDSGGENAVRWSILRSRPAISAGESVAFEIDKTGGAIRRPTKIAIRVHPESTVDESAFTMGLAQALTTSLAGGTFDPSTGVISFKESTTFPVTFVLTAKNALKPGLFTLEIKDAEIGHVELARAGVRLGALQLPAMKPVMGVNLASGEFGNGNVFNKDYLYPDNGRFEWAKKQGFGLIRIPFKFENIQPRVDQDLRVQDMQELDRMASSCMENHLFCILDMHDYGSYYADDGSIKVLGDDGGSNRKFAQLWAELAKRFQTNPYIWFGLMNEPHAQSARDWIKTANAAALAIRDAGAKNKIVFQGSNWDGAHSWVSSDNSQQVLKAYDPLENYAIEAHQYLDIDSSGRSKTCWSGSGAKRLVPFTDWLKAYNLHGIIGEAGWSNEPGCLAEGEEMLRGWRNATTASSGGGYIGFTYWAAGPWWEDGYPYLAEPRPFPNGNPPPMLEQIKKYIP